MSSWTKLAVRTFIQKIESSLLQLNKRQQPMIQTITVMICQIFILKQQSKLQVFNTSKFRSNHYLKAYQNFQKYSFLILVIKKISKCIIILIESLKKMGGQQSQIDSSPRFNQSIIFIKDKLEKDTQKKQFSESFQSYMKQNFYIRIFGCMFGSIIGDALGAFCQFQQQILSDKMLNKTMSMNGGGVFNLYKGQFTDDSQLAYHLLKALTSLQPAPLKQQTNKLLVTILKEYVKWKNSKPFDIGMTCRKGIQVLSNFNFTNNADEEIKTILKKVEQANSSSQSNGSLMRIAPMPIFFSLIKQNPQDFRQFIEDQISLIHSNSVLREAGFIWVKVIYELINREDNQKQTFAKIFQNAEKNAKNEEIQSWFKQSKNDQKISALQKMGWAKIAWTYGMSILYKIGSGVNYQFNYYSQIKKVIAQGGDSDTNAAIVGGLLGAILGFNQLPYQYLQKLFSLQFPKKPSKPIDRPKDYEPINVLRQLLNLIKTCKIYCLKKKASL